MPVIQHRHQRAPPPTGARRCSPLASTLARSSSMARTSSSGSGSPTPHAWLRTRFRCSASSWSGPIRTSAQLAEAGVDAVRGLPARHHTLDHPARSLHPRIRLARNRNQPTVPRHARNLLQRERAAIDLKNFLHATELLHPSPNELSSRASTASRGTCSSLAPRQNSVTTMLFWQESLGQPNSLQPMLRGRAHPVHAHSTENM